MTFFLLFLRDTDLRKGRTCPFVFPFIKIKGGNSQRSEKELGGISRSKLHSKAKIKRCIHWIIRNDEGSNYLDKNTSKYWPHWTNWAIVGLESELNQAQAHQPSSYSSESAKNTKNLPDQLRDCPVQARSETDSGTSAALFIETVDSQSFWIAQTN